MDAISVTLYQVETLFYYYYSCIQTKMYKPVNAK